MVVDVVSVFMHFLFVVLFCSGAMCLQITGLGLRVQACSKTDQGRVFGACRFGERV